VNSGIFHTATPGMSLTEFAVDAPGQTRRHFVMCPHDTIAEPLCNTVPPRRRRRVKKDCVRKENCYKKQVRVFSIIS
jgi:hypothetical protein